MKIGIKYCGGCNPRYDRINIANRIKKDIPGVEIVSASGGGSVDYVLVICGCTSACADRTGLNGKYGMTVITNEKDYDGLINTIKGL